MNTTTEHQAIVTLLAQGRPVWYVAAVTKLRMEEINRVGRSYGYPDHYKLRQALSGLTGTVLTGPTAA
jgi:hypothetical protein